MSCVPLKTDDVKTEDAAYVLSYSVIMLNTDQHNPQNRVSILLPDSTSCYKIIDQTIPPSQQKKMALEDYKRNLRGVNDGEDFSPEYLVSSSRVRWAW
jgi:brefeldin A-resistance guanine nucleotide exchange factor 1